MLNENIGRLSEESESFPNIFSAGNNESLFFVHTGCSMNPTLWKKDLLEVVPYKQKTDIRIGDVIVFISPIDKTILAHRVIAIQEEGFCTKGDNNRSKDSCLLTTEAVFGKVTSVTRNNKRHMISGGMPGLLKARFSIINQRTKTKAIRILYPIYRAALEKSPLKGLGSYIIKPKMAIFREKGKNKFMLLSGDRVIGTYNEESDEWMINYIYRFFISSAKIQRLKPKKD
jgi:hypothetical protein